MKQDIGHYTSYDYSLKRPSSLRFVLLQLPPRLSEEFDASLLSLQRKLKSISNGITSQVSSSKLQYGNTRSYREPDKCYLPFLDLHHKVVSKRPRNHSRRDGRLSEWPTSNERRYDRDAKSSFPFLY